MDWHNAKVTVQPSRQAWNNGEKMAYFQADEKFSAHKNTYWHSWVLFNFNTRSRFITIRPPDSALCHVDAYSGVINIITQTAADTPLYLQDIYKSWG